MAFEAVEKLENFVRYAEESPSYGKEDLIKVIGTLAIVQALQQIAQAIDRLGTKSSWRVKE